MGLILLSLPIPPPTMVSAIQGYEAAVPQQPVEGPATETGDSITFEIQTVLDPPVAPEMTIPEVIGAAAIEFGQDPELLMRVAFCESSHRPAVIGDGGLAVGLFQFHPDTWREESRFLGYTEDLRADPIASSRVAAFMFSQGLQRRWTCYGIVTRRYP